MPQNSQSVIIQKMSFFVKFAVAFLLAFQFYGICVQSSFHIATYPSNWFEASEYCHRKGMRLAIVDTAAKQEALVAEAKTAQLNPELLESAFGYGFWLGATDLARHGVHVWHNTGERVRFAHWGHGEPSGGSEHCVLLQYWPRQGFNWIWNDGHCETTSFYAVCESSERDFGIEEFK